MTTRERGMALGMVSVAALGVAAFLGYQMFLQPLWDMDAQLFLVQQEVKQKEERVAEIEAAKLRMQRLKQLSLPNTLENSRREYDIYLNGLLRDSGFVAGFSVKPNAPEKSLLTMGSKGLVYTRLPYQIVGHATLANLVTMLDRFYRTGFLHQIRRLQVSRPTGTAAQTQTGQLDIHMLVEAVIVAGVDSRKQLLPAVDRRLLLVDVVSALRQAPTGLGLALWASGPTGPAGPDVLAHPARQYAGIAKKDIFFGTAPLNRGAEMVSAPRFIHLTDITNNHQAFFYDRYNNRTYRLRAEAGFDTFLVRDEENPSKTLVRGKILRLDGRDLYFQSLIDDDYYRMHVGESLEEVLDHPLTSAALKTLGLTTVAEKGGNTSN
jgi:hypothetical protein